MRNLKIYTSCSANPNTRFGAYAFFIYDNEAVVKCDVGSNAKKSDISQYCDNFNDI